MKENKRKEAVALRYDAQKDSAPMVIAKGKGKVAENILEAASMHDIPVREDPTLTELLGKLDISQSIPEELYQVVAEVFAFVYKMDKAVKDQ
ncbi:EscU/YscU/HrcU family type III secretion system export apparatus switch protein [Bacillus sp. V5-8f]|uniref:EscU/YscU/HrcU family type III secretion system export apparatus switch protein n=1 Tax=Bacillus sp. V5-8f TaxID=2053044 RepID=UPI000C7889C5|nr:EscU/YscU/HrcU family type III secretion system export apparatus switch protein [Bacillus sp. V5-8f]PLT34226.1 type III secretion system protein [Bacillus sp. V5-8f]